MNSASFLYRLCRGFSALIFRVGWNLKIFHQERIPATGALIVCANHRSYADPPLVAVAMTRPIHFLAKQELFAFKPFGEFIKKLNAHPLNRMGGVGALKASIRILEDDGVISIFPEGGRSLTEEFRPAKAGVGLLAQKSRATILPMYIENSGHWLKGRQLRVVIGHPISPTDITDFDTLGDLVMERIKKLKEEN